METTLTRVSNAVYSICKVMVILLTVEITLVITANIFGRYILDASIYWAEEVVRYSFVWATFIGATCAYKQRALISMSVLTHRLSPQMQWKTGLVLDSVMGLFLLISLLEAGLPSTDMILAQAESHLTAWTQPTLLPVINATGVILHTNLGRAPLSRATIQAMQEAAEDYSTLEYDLEKGQRGSRLTHAEAILQKLTGAEAAVIVNNNASAVLLVLAALAYKKRVIISRSQLVEIGGGFRVPDVMKQSQAKLVEVGTTNRTYAADYAKEARPGDILLKVHRSNYDIQGFTHEAEIAELVRVGAEKESHVVCDLGSGCFFRMAWGFCFLCVLVSTKSLSDCGA